jgi:DNA-binding transcriptional MocR family regulator
LLASPGDTVMVEAPTYFLAGDILRQAGLTLVRICLAMRLLLLLLLLLLLV